MEPLLTLVTRKAWRGYQYILYGIYRGRDFEILDA
jgi:hypothetical protein